MNTNRWQQDDDLEQSGFGDAPPPELDHRYELLSFAPEPETMGWGEKIALTFIGLAGFLVCLALILGAREELRWVRALLT